MVFSSTRNGRRRGDRFLGGSAAVIDEVVRTRAIKRRGFIIPGGLAALLAAKIELPCRARPRCECCRQSECAAIHSSSLSYECACPNQKSARRASAIRQSRRSRQR